MDPHSITTVPPAAAHFMTAAHYAVVGRVLHDPARFDARAIQWYAARGMDVVPVRPPGKFDNTTPLDGRKVLDSVTDIPDIAHTSLSMIISPALGLDMLRALFSGARETWPVSVWFQPGAESPEIARFVQERGLQERVIMGGLCLFVHGDRAREMAKL